MTRECSSPHASSGTPRIALPAGATDCHAHVFDDTSRFPLSPTRSYEPSTGTTLAAYRAMLAGLGIDRSVLVQASVYGTDNRCMLDALMQLGPTAARGVAVVDSGITRYELETMHAMGVRGVRFNALTAGGTALDDLPDVARRVVDLGWHVQLWVSPASLEALTPILLEVEANLVLDHMAQLSPGEPSGPQMLRLDKLMRTGRTWVKLSSYRCSGLGYPYDDVRPLTREVAGAWPDRCVWGSDWPHPMLPGDMPYDSDLVDLLDACLDSGAARRKILVDNPAALYGFPPAVSLSNTSFPCTY